MTFFQPHIKISVKSIAQRNRYLALWLWYLVYVLENGAVFKKAHSNVSFHFIFSKEMSIIIFFCLKKKKKKKPKKLTSLVLYLISVKKAWLQKAMIFFPAASKKFPWNSLHNLGQNSASMLYNSESTKSALQSFLSSRLI